MNETKQYHPDRKADAATTLIDQAMSLLSEAELLGPKEAFATEDARNHLSRARESLIEARRARQHNPDAFRGA